MDVNVKHPWHEQLRQLDGFPLVACGGDKRPYQKGWQTKSLTPEQIIAEDCAAVGLRCGEDSEIVGFDLDGNTAVICNAEGANPMNTARGSGNVATLMTARWSVYGAGFLVTAAKQENRPHHQGRRQR